MQALILADGDVAPRARIDAVWPGWLDSRAVVIAADGGARHATRFDVTIDHWVGDGDSLGAPAIDELARAGVDVALHPVDKDETDMELAMLAAVGLGVESIVVVGALGGPRLDHALANVGLLTSPAMAGRDVRLMAPDVRIRLLQAPDGDGRPASIDLDGRIGDAISLLPTGDDALGVSTTGLRYPLDDEPLGLGRTRGLSNVRTAPTATVGLRRGRLLVIESPATL